MTPKKCLFYIWDVRVHDLLEVGWETWLHLYELNINTTLTRRNSSSMCPCRPSPSLCLIILKVMFLGFSNSFQNMKRTQRQWTTIRKRIWTFISVQKFLTKGKGFFFFFWKNESPVKQKKLLTELTTYLELRRTPKYLTVCKVEWIWKNTVKDLKGVTTIQTLQWELCHQIII